METLRMGGVPVLTPQVTGRMAWACWLLRELLGEWVWEVYEEGFQIHLIRIS